MEREIWFNNLPPLLRKNIEEVSSYLEEKEGKKSLLELLLQVKPEKLLKEVPLSKLLIYHRWKSGKSFSIDKVLSKGKYVRILLCKEELRGKKIVAKWFRFQERTVEEESNNYEKLKKLGCPLPFFTTHYRFWNEPLLIMEQLQPLGKQEDYLALGRDVLEQLEYLHNFGVHNDIKVNNIMKGVNRYFLIDYGGVAKKPFQYGYLRWTWSEKWTCQKIHSQDQVTTAKHDFIELGYTMQALSNFSSQGCYGEIRKKFSGKIKEYMSYVRGLREESITKGDYQQLKNILT